MKKEKKTTLDFYNELNTVYPEEFEVTGEYVNNRTKIMVKHITCRNEFLVHPYDFLNKRQSRCKFCHQKERMKNKLEKYLLKNKIDKTYSYDFKDAVYQYDKVEFYCNNCKNNFDKVLDLFLHGQHCPYCSNQRTNRNSAQYKIDKLTKEGEFTILNEDVNKHDSKVSILHNECNRVTETSLNYFITQNPICHHCNKEKLKLKRMKTNEQFKNELEELYAGQYELLSEYNGATNKVEIRHKHCENILEVKANSITSLNFGCKFCNMSMPESIIFELLKSKGVHFITQYKFDDCKGKVASLPFDFAIFENEKLKFIIEYDGQHHFSEKAFGKESYERTVKNDKIKNDYCKDNGIAIYRISYKELENIKDIVLDILEENLLYKC